MFRVRMEQEAGDNLRELYQGLQERYPGSSCPVDWYYGIKSAIQDLADSGERCGLAYEDRYFAETIRHKLYDSYRILFTIRGDCLHVLHIRHQSQDPDDLIR